MTPRDFSCWLQGFFDLSGAKTLTEPQLTMVKRHLDMVMVHDKPQAAIPSYLAQPTPSSNDDSLIRC